MKTSHTIGFIFIVDAIILGLFNKMWLIGLPMDIIGLCYLTGVISDDDHNE